MKSVRGKKKSLFIRFCIFAFAAYVVVSLITLQMEISSKRSLLTSVNAQLEDQVVANKEVERQIALGDGRDFMARIARDKLDMGVADERVFRDTAGT